MLVVAVIAVDACPFFRFLRPDLSLQEYRNRCFLVVLCQLTVTETELGSSDKEVYPSAGKNIGVVLVPY